jgi:hypothetical protein
VARLQRQLRDLRAQPQTPDVQRQIAAITRQIERLQRGNASTLRTTRYATLALHLATPPPVHHHTQRWPWLAGGGAALLVLVAAALLAWRAVRRRREAALLRSA